MPGAGGTTSGAHVPHGVHRPGDHARGRAHHLKNREGPLLWKTQTLEYIRNAADSFRVHAPSRFPCNVCTMTRSLEEALDAVLAKLSYLFIFQCTESISSMRQILMQDDYRKRVYLVEMSRTVIWIQPKTGQMLRNFGNCKCRQTHRPRGGEAWRNGGKAYVGTRTRCTRRCT